jgi:hypothetical protein
MTSTLLGPQFHATSSFNMPKKPAKKTADAVYDQLTEDYPKDTVDWVHNIKWKGPVEVPLKRTDFDEKNSWRAEHQPEKVNLFKRRIKQAERKGEGIKPVVMIQRPDNTAMIMDGHHRALAYKELNLPIHAWLGYPGKSKGPWDEVHDYQFKPDSGPQREGNKNENVYR